MLVNPYKSVGVLSFGDERRKVRKILNVQFESGVKQFDEMKDYYDYFKSIGLFVYYDLNDIATAFEFYESAPVFNDKDLLTTPYKLLFENFQSIDPEIEKDYNGFTSYLYGIAITINNDPDDDETMPESAMIFKKGYYE